MVCPHRPLFIYVDVMDVRKGSSTLAFFLERKFFNMAAVNERCPHHVHMMCISVCSQGLFPRQKCKWKDGHSHWP